MKSRFFRAAIASVVLAAFFSLNLHARPKTNTPADVAALLTEAYADLDRADHDYKGHRIKAMEQIDRAGKVLKLNLRGDGHGHEKQGVSDEQLAAVLISNVATVGAHRPVLGLVAFDDLLQNPGGCHARKIGAARSSRQRRFMNSCDRAAWLTT